MQFQKKKKKKHLRTLFIQRGKKGFEKLKISAEKNESLTFIVPVSQIVSISQETNFCDENTYQGIVFIKKIKKVQKVISVGFQGPPKSKLTFGPISRRNTDRQKKFFQ